MSYLVTLMERYAPQGRQALFDAVAKHDARHPQHPAKLVAEPPDFIGDGKAKLLIYRVADLDAAQMLHMHAADAQAMPRFEFERIEQRIRKIGPRAFEVAAHRKFDSDGRGEMLNCFGTLRAARLAYPLASYKPRRQYAHA